MGQCFVLGQRTDALSHVINHCDHLPCDTNSVHLGVSCYATVKKLPALNSTTHPLQSTLMWLTVVAVALRVPAAQPLSGVTHGGITVNYNHPCRTAAIQGWVLPVAQSYKNAS